MGKMKAEELMTFDQSCQQCPRLASFLGEVKSRYPEYHARPVAPFGVQEPKLLIVGLAPGMHGANASGRPFTGDYAGILLYQMLFDFGFSNNPVSVSLQDGLELYNARITNAVKCLPPQNKPTGEEIRQCNAFLAAELASLPENAVILVLGNIAHQAVLKAYNLKLNRVRFAHNSVYQLPDARYLVSSYHCSRYNVQTNRLTAPMFRAVFDTVVGLINSE